jgi:hypothetical protein
MAELKPVLEEKNGFQEARQIRNQVLRPSLHTRRK